MGDNTDFYKPKPSETVCSALDSSNKFLWSATLDGNYVDAGDGDFGSPGHKGGSLEFWPRDNVDGDQRRHLPFWGHFGEISDGTDGCCHLTKDDNKRWGLDFKIFVLKVWTFCPSRECIDVCIARYGTPIQKTSPAFYCAKGCADLGVLGPPIEVVNDDKCSIVEADRYSTCLTNMGRNGQGGCSNYASKYEICRDGCKFWEI